MKTLQFAEGSSGSRPSLRLLIVTVLLVVLVVMFQVSPLGVGDDWETFYGAGRRVLNRAPLYGELVTFAYYSNPPWLAVLLAPISALPFRWGWSVITAANLIVAAAVARRLRLRLLHLVMALVSPPMIYTLLHGQIDGLALGGVLLPPEWWLLVGLTKPQVAIGLMVGVPRSRWVRALIVTGLVMLASLILFGNWPLALIRQPTPFIWLPHNLWWGLWPFQVPVGVALAALGVDRRDERYLLAASPFFLPYAAISSLLGPWLVACSGLKGWQVVLINIVWWGAVFYRAF